MGLFDIQHSAHIFRHRAHPSCVAAVLNGDKDSITNLCKFSFSTTPLEPNVLHIGDNQLLLTAVKNYTNECEPGNFTTYQTEAVQLQLTLQCHCNFHSAAGSFINKQTPCGTSTTEESILYPINLSFLEKVFGPQDLAAIGAQTYLKNLTEIEMPTVNIFSSNYTKERADLTTWTYKL